MFSGVKFDELPRARLPECNSVRSRPGWAEPEVVFRIVHAALADASAPAAFREQTVEVALGPKVAFQTGSGGPLTRWVPADRVVAGAPPRRGNPKTAKEPKTPRVVELLRKAVAWQRQLDAGEVRDQAEIARREGVSRARVTQIIGMLRLAPHIQEQIHSLPETVRRPAVTERALRPIAQLEDPKAQAAKFRLLRRQSG